MKTTENQFSIDYIGGAVPTQAWGNTSAGDRYYFRARSGQWTLHFGRDGNEGFGQGAYLVARGPINPQDPHPLDGSMEDHEVERILGAFCI